MKRHAKCHKNTTQEEDKTTPVDKRAQEPPVGSIGPTMIVHPLFDIETDSLKKASKQASKQKCQSLVREHGKKKRKENRRKNDKRLAFGLENLAWGSLANVILGTRDVLGNLLHTSIQGLDSVECALRIRAQIAKSKQQSKHKQKPQRIHRHAQVQKGNGCEQELMMTLLVSKETVFFF